ncbi:MAG: hypothetical protein WBR26_19740 [Candidatus Acidiferrum sp.]
MKLVRITAVFLVLASILPSAIVYASPKHKTVRALVAGRVVVSARRVNNAIEYRIGDSRYSKAELREGIGEMRLSASEDSSIVIVMEDTMTLSDIKEVPQMALDAGVKYARVFVYWKGTGNMAELFFGPVMKHNLERLPD